MSQFPGNFALHNSTKLNLTKGSTDSLDLPENWVDS